MRQYFNRAIWLKAFIVLLLGLQIGCTQFTNEPIKVGILHAQTGVMAVSEQPVIDATLMAIDEINKSGGILGRQLEAIVVDTQSSDERAVMLSKQLIEKDRVEVVFGCWTSSCRKSVKPIFEKSSHLLFYPVQYEGLEASPNIIYLGSLPNQQLMPATRWMNDKYGPRILLIASDYVFPRVANKLITKQLNALNAKVEGEFYYPLGHRDFSAIPKYIKTHNITAILNTLNGSSNTALFEVLTEQEIDTPIMSFSLSAQEIKTLNISDSNHIYAAESYFQTIDSISNNDFKQRIYTKFGDDAVISAPMVSAYNGVNLWRQTVERLKGFNTSSVRQAMLGEMTSGPSGVVRISRLNNHTWNPFYIAKLNTRHGFDIVDKIKEPLRPMPFPSYGSKQYWYDYLESLYRNWGNSWSNKHADKVTGSVIR